MDGAGDVSATVFAVFTDIQKNGILTVIELGGFGGSYGFCTAEESAGFKKNEQRKRAEKGKDQDRVVAGKFGDAREIHELQGSVGEVGGTENFTHHPDQPQRAGIADPVVNAVGILARGQYALVAEDGQVLGNIALRGTHVLNNVLNADFLIAQCAENFQSQRVGHGLEGARRSINVFVAGNKGLVRHHIHLCIREC